MKKLSIWFLQTGEPLPLKSGLRKMRTALLIDECLKREFSIFWWASAFEHQRKMWISNRDRTFIINPNYTIRVLRGCSYRKNISIMRYLDHRIVAWKFRKQSKEIKKPDIIVASMPCYHFAFEGMRYARHNKIPFLVDIRDPWPDIFLTPLKQIGLNKLGKIALTFDFKKLVILLRQANGIVATSRGFLEWGLDKIDRAKGDWDKVFYHGYKIGDEESKDDFCPLPEDLEGKKIILFVGTFGDSYELKLVLEVAKRFYRDGVSDILFFLAGTGSHFESLKRETASLPNIIMSGWISKAEIRKILICSWAGMVPCNSAKNTAPNKVFEYLSAGLPLISSLEGEIAQLIVKYNIGLNYLPGDSEGLYQSICKLTSDLDFRNRMAANALKFFEKFGDADKIYSEYATHIEKMTENYKKSHGLKVKG